jgi:acyl carrier protein
VGVWDEEALNASMPVEDYGLDSLKVLSLLALLVQKYEC